LDGEELPAAGVVSVATKLLRLPRHSSGDITPGFLQPSLLQVELHVKQTCLPIAARSFVVCGHDDWDWVLFANIPFDSEIDRIIFIKS